MDFCCSPSRGASVTTASAHCRRDVSLRPTYLKGFRGFQLLVGMFLCFVKISHLSFLPLLKSTALHGRFCRSELTLRNLVLSRQKCNLVTEIINPKSILIIIFCHVRVNKMYLSKYHLLWCSVSKSSDTGRPHVSQLIIEP